jgi:hypothetical protein
LQSDNFSPILGTKIDLSNGSIQTISKSGSVKIKSDVEDNEPYFEIKHDANVLINIGKDEYYL